MNEALRAEFLKLLRRPAAWLLFALGPLDVLFWVYFLGYGYYLQVKAGVIHSSVSLSVLARSFLPDQILRAALGQSGDMLILGLVLGALVAGSEYGWGTIKTELTAGHSRLSIYATQLVVLALYLALLVPAIFLATTGASLLITEILRQPISWPETEQIPEALGAAYLILAMPTALGMLCATLARSAALGMAVAGAVFSVIEGIVSQFSFGSSLLQGIVDWMPGDNAISLSTVFGPLGGSRYSVLVGPVQADARHYVLVLVLYTVLFIVVGAAVYSRRDVA